MIQRLVAAALRMPFIVLSVAVIIILAGLGAYSDLDIEAYPNPVPPLVEIITQPDGWSAEEVERYVTIPLEIGLSGMQGLDHVRSQSLFGLSDVKCYFSWETGYTPARQEVINRIQFVQLPNGMEAQLSPWNAIGEVFRYQVVGKGYSQMELKTAEDWLLERQFKQVRGVIDVVSFGGETKQYHIGVDPYRLSGQGVTLNQLEQAVQAANTNVGGQRLVIGEQAYAVRAIGLIQNVHDIENIVLAQTKGIPVRVRDVAQTSVGPAPRLGIVGHDDNPDIVQGVVLMRYGGETPSTLRGIHERIDYIRKNHILPPGMNIVPYYDRGNLVKLTTHTVLHNLIEGMLLVAIVLYLFLGQFRAALITAINIPIALLIAFIGMVSTHTPANLISLGAVDFGIVVDSTVIMMENIFRHLGGQGKGTMNDRILAGAREVAGPMTFSTLIIGVAFLPLFTMTGVAGVIFSPMAMTYAFAIGGAICLALTLTPVLAGKFVPSHAEEKDPPIMRALHRVYTPMFAAALKYPRRTRRPRNGPGGARPAGLHALRRRVHAAPRGGELLDSRDASDVDLARAVRPVRRQDSRDPPRVRGGEALRRGDRQAPRGAHGRLAARAPGRRHRRGRLPEHRALRAAEAVRRVAARPDEGQADRGAVRRARGGVPWRRLQLLADDQRQRRGGGERGQRGELGQGLRPRPPLERGERPRDRRRDERASTGSRTSACSSRWGSRA